MKCTNYSCDMGLVVRALLDIAFTGKTMQVLLYIAFIRKTMQVLLYIAFIRKTMQVLLYISSSGKRKDPHQCETDLGGQDGCRDIEQQMLLHQ